MKPSFVKNVIEQARIIGGYVLTWLRRDVSAVVLKHRIYFGCGIYRPSMERGVEFQGGSVLKITNK
ncbi:MAG: hypothetical protein ABGW96_00680 [Methylophilaceae bacterium]